MSEPIAGTDVALIEAGQTTKFIEQYAPSFAAVVPRHIDPTAFVELASAYVRRDKRLREAAKANPGSLIIALRECAALGHLPMKGTYALVPFKNRQAPGGWEITGVEEVGAVIERMFRAGGVQSVHAEVVRQNDPVFRWSRNGGSLPVHEFDWSASTEERGPLIGTYCWARLLGGGTSECVVLNRHQVQKYRNVSKSGDAFWGPEWPDEGPWTEAMWIKTGLHRLERYVPTSAAYRWELAASEAAAGRPAAFPGVPDQPVRPAMNDVEPVDAVVVDDQPRSGGLADWPPTPRPPDSP